MPYLPSQTRLDKILISLGIHYSKNELALPGNWSGEIFVKDLTSNPVESKDKLCQVFYRAMTRNWTYRRFLKNLEVKIERYSNIQRRSGISLIEDN